MPADKNRTTLFVSAGIFASVAGLLTVIHGHRLVLDAIDEGIVLDSAQRMAGGAVPYVDFFAYMSPGGYWIQSLVFQLFGISLFTGRIPMIFEVALQCGLVFWLTSRLASRKAGAVAAFLFTGFEIANAGNLIGQHRWDSSALALGALCLMLAGLERPRPAVWWLGGGVAMGMAAWCTPSMAIPIGAVFLWACARKEHRCLVIPFAAGIGIIGLAGVGILAAQGALGAFLKHLAWLKTNYSVVNVMPYGAVNGGMADLLKGAQGMERAMLLVIVTFMELPAILPVLAVALWLLVWKLGRINKEERGVIALLLLLMIALIATAYPRPDVAHLVFVAAIPYVLTVAAIARLIPSSAGIWVSVVPCLFSLMFGGTLVREWMDSRTMPSPVGPLQVSRRHVDAMQDLLSTVHPGQGLYVHPYMPVYYFLTQGRNPTRFCYLAPGMMTVNEELETLEGLKANPPQWVLYLQLSREAFLRVFPSGAGVDNRYRTLEQWLEQNYKPLDDKKVNVMGYELWQRRN